MDVSGGWFGFEKGVVFAPTWRIRPHDLEVVFFTMVVASPLLVGLDQDPFPNTKLDDPPSTPPHPVKEGLAWDARATKKKTAQDWHPGGVNWPPAGVNPRYRSKIGEVWHSPL